MNKERRAEIARAIELMATAAEILEVCASEESEYHDNMPESIQSGERGERAQAAVDALTEAADALNEAMYRIQEVAES